MSDQRLTCIHQPLGVQGLCYECELEYLEDPSGWMEFGDHPDGLQRWEMLKQEMIRRRNEPNVVEYNDEDIPF